MIIEIIAKVVGRTSVPKNPATRDNRKANEGLFSKNSASDCALQRVGNILCAIVSAFFSLL